MGKKLKVCIAIFLALTVMVQYSKSPQILTAYGEDNQTETTQAAETKAPEPKPAPQETAPPAPTQAETAAPTEAPKATEAAETENEAANDPAEGSTSEEMETEVTEETEATEEEETEYPAVSFSESAGGMAITFHAPEGALPEGAKVRVTPVSADQIMDAVEGLVGEEVEKVKAADITFYNKDGKEVKPKKAVSVKMSASSMTADSVVHIADSGAANAVSASTSGSTAAFKTKDFSIYAIVENGVQDDDARLTVTFFKADGSKTEIMITKNQLSQIEMYIYDPGSGEIADGELFKGWTTEEDYTGTTKAKTIKDVRKDVTDLLNAGVKEGDHVEYYAMVFHAIKITYLDEKGVTVKTDQVLLPRSQSSSDYTVNHPYTPYANSDENLIAQFAGWQQLIPKVEGQEVIYQNNETTTVSEDTTLKATVSYGHWLSFNENLRNASFTEPQFVASGGTPTRPADPTRVGYKFGGWYTADASDERDGQVSGDPFDFNQELTANTTVHAKWIKNETASYSVVIWLQNVSGEGYDYGETVTVNNAPVGEPADGVSPQGQGNNRYARIDNRNYRYTGFHLDKYDTGVTVNAEGNSVVNVYYNRNGHTFTFKRGNQTIHTVTRLYGQDISDIWTFRGSDGRNYPQIDPPTSWQPTGSQTYTARITRMEIMPDEDLTFNHMTTDKTTRYYNYYVEALPGATGTRTYNGTQYSLYTDLTHDFQIIYYEDDFWNLEGFSRYAIATANGTNVTNTIRNARDGVSWQFGWNSNLYFYYSRNAYDIVYMDGTYVDGDGNIIKEDSLGEIYTEAGIKYEYDIKDKKNYTPTRDGYVFLGWYADEGCTKEYDFKTMPAHNVTVYAKWVATEYNVVLHPNDSTSDPIKYTSATQSESFYVDAGDKVSDVGGERIYSDLIGWYTDEALTQPFDFDAIVLNSTTIAKYGDAKYREPEWPSVVGQLNLYAKWRDKLDGAEGITVVYDPGNGTVDPVEDPRKYADKADAIAEGAATSSDPEMVFSHWVVQKWNGSAFVDTDVKVYPADTFVVKAADAKVENITPSEAQPEVTKKYIIQLRAEYIEKDKETITFINWYDNYTGGKVAENKDLKINQAVDIPAAPTRPGYEFKGWIRGIEEDGTTTSLTDLYLTYDGSNYKHGDNTVKQVAADEKLVGDGTQHHAMYAKWEAKDVDYTVKFFYQEADGTYSEGTSLQATRQAKTDTDVSVTNEDKGQTKDGTYSLNEEKNTKWTATVVGDGSTVLEVYFDLNAVDVTVEHYLRGEETAFKTETVGDQSVGDTYEATPETTYQGKDLTVDSYDPSQSITISSEENVIKIYYTLSLTITAKSDSKTYDGDPLDGEYTIEGALADDKETIKNALGDAPSITEVSESPKDYLTEEDQAKITDIPEYYEVSYTP